MVSPRSSMCMNYPCWSIFIYVFLCCSMLLFMFIIVHLYVYCLWLSMSIRAHISKMIRAKCSRFISNHRCFEFLGGWEASPPTPITWGWLDGFFPSKKTNIPYLNGPLNMCKSSTFFHGFIPPEKNIAYLNGPLNIGVNPKQKTHGKNGGV